MGESDTLRGDSDRRLAFLAFLKFESGDVSSLPSTLMTSYSKEGGLEKDKVRFRSEGSLILMFCFDA